MTPEIDTQRDMTPRKLDGGRHEIPVRKQLIPHYMTQPGCRTTFDGQPVVVVSYDENAELLTVEEAPTTSPIPKG